MNGKFEKLKKDYEKSMKKEHSIETLSFKVLVPEHYNFKTGLSIEDYLYKVNKERYGFNKKSIGIGRLRKALSNHNLFGANYVIKVKSFCKFKGHKRKDRYFCPIDYEYYEAERNKQKNIGDIAHLKISDWDAYWNTITATEKRKIKLLTKNA